MMKDGKRKLKPNLRFPEFRNAPDWEVDLLGSRVIKVGSGITPTGGESNYRRSGRPFVRSQNVGWGELILDDVVFIDDDLHRTFAATEVRLHDVLLNITGASIGRSAVADSRIAGGNVNQHVCIIRSEEKALIPTFLNQYLLSNYGQSQIDSFQAGGNRQGLNFAQVRSFSIPLPPTTAEQQKIANCLTSVDELITAHGQELDALKTHKIGLMQQLFPREVETFPRLRFPGFVEDWKDNSLDGICDSVSSGKDKADPCGAYDLYGSTGVIGKVSNYSYEGEYVLVARVGANAGLLTKASGKFGVTDNALVISLKPNTSVDFIFYYLDSLNLNKLVYGSGQPLITGGQLRLLPVLLPIESERQKIVSCLSTLDELIAAQTKKLEAVKTHKKGLMQQLFPSPEEAL